MMVLDIIKIRLRMPSTWRFISSLGVAISAVGAVTFIFGLPYSSFPLAGLGIALWRLAEWRLEKIGRKSR